MFSEKDYLTDLFCSKGGEYHVDALGMATINGNIDHKCSPCLRLWPHCDRNRDPDQSDYYFDRLNKEIDELTKWRDRSRDRLLNEIRPLSKHDRVHRTLRGKEPAKKGNEGNHCWLFESP